MSRNQRRKKRRQKANQRKSNEPRATPVAPATAASWHWYVAVIILALILFAIFIISEFEPRDRLVMLGVSVVCAGIAFLIIGTFTAVGNFNFEEESWVGRSLGYLAQLVTPHRRSGSLYYSRRTVFLFFEKIMITLAIPLGFVMAFLRPKQTWPAILWIGGGLLAFLGTYLGSVVIRSLTD